MNGKWYLVPETVLNPQQMGQLKVASEFEAQGPKRQLDAYTQALETLLRVGKDDENKQRLFNEAYQKFQNFKSAELDRPVSSAVAETVKSAPLVYGNKKAAKNLLDYIETRPEISVNDKTKEIMIKGGRVPGSNINTIIGDLIRNVRSAPAIGAMELKNYLIDETDMPKSLIKNTYRKKLSEEQNFTPIKKLPTPDVARKFLPSQRTRKPPTKFAHEYHTIYPPSKKRKV